MRINSQKITFSYPGKELFTFPDLALKGGDQLLILGKSGSGKSTFMNLLSGLLTPISGTIEVDGQNLSRMSTQELDQFRGKSIGIVFQKPHLLAPLSVKENLEVAPYFGQAKGQSIAELLADLGIENKAKSSVQTLSEGEAQRVSIARALMNKPRLILADEPTSSLDDENAEKVIALLIRQAKKIDAALIVVTHDQRVRNQIKDFVEVNKQ